MALYLRSCLGVVPTVLLAIPTWLSSIEVERDDSTSQIYT
jgi:hypothetical protein